MSGSLTSSELTDRCGKIRALVLDVDGVMTDGKLTFLPDNQESKTFHVRDGLGIQLLLAAGIHVAVISGRESDLVARRCSELGVSLLLQGINDKVAAVEQIR
ncbi:MAG: phenylphosphate carboxylase subunit delta, partial [Myxococcota bacterium]